MAEFLRMLAATHSVTAAAKSVGLTRQSAYKLRSWLKGKAFDVAWEVAFRHGYDNLAHAALERALNGVEVPHYYKGEVVGTSRRYDERLTVALLAMSRDGGVPVLGRHLLAAERHAPRFEALLGRIESEGDLAEIEPEEGLFADSAEMSPAAAAAFLEELQGFNRRYRG
jgi:hypothetical protein